jgi:hypothetical protein
MSPAISRPCRSRVALPPMFRSGTICSKRATRLSATISVPTATPVLRVRPARKRPSGALQLELHARPNEVTEPDGTRRTLRVLTVMVVSRRSSVRRRYQT